MRVGTIFTARSAVALASAAVGALAEASGVAAAARLARQPNDNEYHPGSSTPLFVHCE